METVQKYLQILSYESNIFCTSTVENRISDYIVEILLSGKVDSGNCIRRGNPRVYSKNKIKKRQGKAEGNLDKGVRH